ncbi:MAG: PilZ domain-containing protein [Pacificimonas sp.]
MSLAVTEADTEMRSAERLSVELAAEARDSGAMRIHGVISDLSLTGFRFESPLHVPVGTKLYLRLADMRGFQAVVVRSGQGHYGCAFLKPLYPPIYRKLAGLLG